VKAQCIQAVAQAIGRTLTQQELKDIEARVRQQLQAMAREDLSRFLSLPANARLLEAGQRAAAGLVHEATLKKVRVALTIMAHDRVQAYMKDAAARGIDKLDALDRLIAFKADGKSGVQSAETRARSVRDNALRQLLDAFEASDPKFFGLFENREGVRDLTREMFGEQTGNAMSRRRARPHGTPWPRRCASSSTPRAATLASSSTGRCRSITRSCGSRRRAAMLGSATSCRSSTAANT
jgi:hypothetical protein